MKIQILGTGCPKCKRTYENAERAVKDLGISAEVEKVEDLKAIMGFGVMITPALAVDGQVKVTGKVPAVDEIKKFILEKGQNEPRRIRETRNLAPSFLRERRLTE